MSLSAIYSEIRKRCVIHAQEWPQAQKMRSFCHRDHNDFLQPPAFTDGYGPIGAFAMLNENQSATKILQECRAIFERFVNSICDQMDEKQEDEFRKMIFWCDESTWHSCVAIFHEHPSLLDEESRQCWSHIDIEKEKELGKALEKKLKTLGLPKVTLDSLCICPDGAMIVGFVDDNEENFQRLRKEVIEVGKKVLDGKLTSRPKSLIHVTIGRVLGLPEDLEYSAAERIAEIVQKFNVSKHIASVAVEIEDCSLMRDEIWWMKQCKEILRCKISQP